MSYITKNNNHPYKYPEFNMIADIIVSCTGNNSAEERVPTRPRSVAPGPASSDAARSYRSAPCPASTARACASVWQVYGILVAFCFKSRDLNAATTGHSWVIDLLNHRES